MERFKVYVVRDREAIEFLLNDDVEGFKENLEGEGAPEFEEPVIFDSVAEGLAFCAGLGYGVEERDLPSSYPLRSWEEEDRRFIKALEQ